MTTSSSTTPSSTTDCASFCKIITFDNGRQCVVYFDHSQEDPTLKIVMNSHGIVSSTNVGFEGSDPIEAKKKMLLALMDLYDGQKAWEMVQFLDATVEKNLIHKFFPNTPHTKEPFAGIVRNQGQVDLLLVKDTQEDNKRNTTYIIKEITPTLVQVKEYDTKEERDQVFGYRTGASLVPTSKAFKR